jgi:hypothetical protein
VGFVLCGVLIATTRPFHFTPSLLSKAHASVYLLEQDALTFAGIRTRPILLLHASKVSLVASVRMATQGL